MDIYRIWDIVRNLDTEELGMLVKELAIIEARTRYEVLSQVLSLLYKAEEKGMGISELKNIVADWLTNAEDLYEELILNDPLYRFVESTIDNTDIKEAVKATITSSK